MPQQIHQQQVNQSQSIPTILTLPQKLPSQMKSQFPQTHLDIMNYNTGLNQTGEMLRLSGAQFQEITNRLQVPTINMQNQQQHQVKKEVLVPKKRGKKPKCSSANNSAQQQNKKIVYPSSYMIYFNDNFQSYKLRYPDLKVNEIAKLFGKNWKELDESIKVQYKKISDFIRDNPIQGVPITCQGIIIYKKAMGINVDEKEYQKAIEFLSNKLDEQNKKNGVNTNEKQAHSEQQTLENLLQSSEVEEDALVENQSHQEEGINLQDDVNMNSYSSNSVNGDDDIQTAASNKQMQNYLKVNGMQLTSDYYQPQQMDYLNPEVNHKIINQSTEDLLQKYNLQI
eukprot:403340766